jgi:hypothetical protein
MTRFTGPLRRHGRPSLLALLAAAGLALGVTAAAAPPELFPRPAPSPDLELTVKAKAALAADPVLAGVNPVVSIVDRVAVVGGPVPSAAAADRLAEVLRGVPGLADVRVSCWVEAPDDPLKKLVADRLRASAPAPPPAAAPPAAAVDTLPDPRPAAQVVVQRAAGALLLDPAAPRDGRSARAVPQPYPTIPAPAVPVRPDQDVAAAVAVVRGADPRFAGLTAAVRGDAVLIAGRAADGDAWDFAAAVRRVPGVGRVVLGRIDGR